ncbi:hypothetical protein AYO40_05675, partial [Planctomycetaceae bacterium SCGC AG-212-D15]
MSRIKAVTMTGMVAGVLLGVLLAPGRAADAKPAQPSPAAIRFFETKVRPILAGHCFECHGEKKHKGGLRLDSRGALLAGGDQGPAIVPGDPNKSLFVKAINHSSDELKMPPSKKLPKEAIADLTRWVALGAPWPGADTAAKPVRTQKEITAQDRAFWSFQPVKRPLVPPVNGSEIAANPIDAFIRAKLAAKGLLPVSAASKQALIRRAYYDLLGLPPTPEEVERFVNDNSPKAYEALIDRLLDSPRYGEKWGRYWLDLVRYAESNSYERDNPKPHAWRYRDYVIRSFNADKPYDRFVREQLAGDELPDGGNDGIIATGYYRLGIWDDEPTDREQARYDGLDDIVATTGQVFLGLTMDCARCHDHKIDPILQRDYYKMVSFMQGMHDFHNGGRTDEVPLFNNAASRADYDRCVKELEAKRNAVQVKISALEKEFVHLYEIDRGERVRQPDLDELSYRFYRDTWEKLPDFASVKPENRGKLENRLFDLTPRTRNEAFGFVFEGVLIVPQAGKYTFYLDSADGSRLSVAGKNVIEYDGRHPLGKEKQATVELTAGRLPIQLEYFQHSSKPGLKVAWSGAGFERRTLSAAGNAPLSGRDLGQLLGSHGARLLGKAKHDEMRQLRKEMDALLKERIPAEMALAVTEMGNQAGDTFVMARGNAHAPGDKVEPGFPEVIGTPAPKLGKPAPGARTCGRRSLLADWIASKDNPLTARVMANRIWQYHFGRGIVRSPNNFGFQGDKPTHPELLDWLAAEFVAQGWRLKPLHRLIMTSEAYQRASTADAKALTADPINDLFWRFDMRRLTAEEVRDSLLAVNGTLNLKMFGPSIYVEIPREIMAGQSMPGHNWGKSSPEEAARRSVYIHVKRSLVTPILDTFDLAETDRSTPVRFVTTQPTQALAMLNSDFLNQQAAIFAARLKKDAGGDTAKQVERALYLATQRKPEEKQVRRGVELIGLLREKEGASAEVALRYFCLMALNLNEFVYL